MEKMEPRFDIFSGQIDKNALWVETVEGLSNARERMEQIAAEKPGQVFHFLAAESRGAGTNRDVCQFFQLQVKGDFRVVCSGLRAADKSLVPAHFSKKKKSVLFQDALFQNPIS